MSSNDERITETTRIISEDEVPPDILEKIRRKEENHADKKAKAIGKSFGEGLAAMVKSAGKKPVGKIPVDEISGDVQPAEKISAETQPVAKKLGDKISAKSHGVNLSEAELNRQREARIRDKAKNLTDKFLKGVK